MKYFRTNWNLERFIQEMNYRTNSVTLYFLHEHCLEIFLFQVSKVLPLYLHQVLVYFHWGNMTGICLSYKSTENVKMLQFLLATIDRPLKRFFSVGTKKCVEMQLAEL